eukprot:TRINITY_DN14555_c0_g1_i1.p1 TRINITY_DN14555_c0_g1~~TRINITY_DN14555_c0_g1_i1.p1  ORF type:complete len:202 (+),score=17.28 TRINITY_DN14555_c0_g1_i1:160-765(+)
MGVQTLRRLYDSPNGQAQRVVRKDAKGSSSWRNCCFGLCSQGRSSFLSGNNLKGLTKNPHGFVKVIEAIIALAAHVLLLMYGVENSGELGFSFPILLSGTSASFIANTVLAIVYMTSSPSKVHIKSSLFELLFNLLLSAIYFIISSVFAWNVHRHLLYYYYTKTNFNAYPCLLASSALGIIAGIIHGLDGFFCLQDYRKYN